MSIFSGTQRLLAYDLGILLKQPKFTTYTDWALFCSVLYFGLLPTPQLDLGVILLLGLFTNILKFTTMQKDPPKLSFS